MIMYKFLKFIYLYGIIYGNILLMFVVIIEILLSRYSLNVKLLKKDKLWLGNIYFWYVNIIDLM